MILERNGTLLPTDDFTQYTFGSDVHYVNGFFYIPGFLAGEESSRQVQRILEETGSVPFDQMYGAFSYCIRRANGEIFFFPCNSQLHCLYVSDHAFSSRYLEHLEYLRDRGHSMTFEDETLCEYYTLGDIFFGKTFVKEITNFSNTQYIHCKEGCIEILDKGIGDISTPSKITDPDKFYADLAYAMSDMPPKSVAISLTGGYDSRMVYSQLYDKVPLRVFLSANNFIDLADIPVSQKICEVTGEELELVHPQKPEITEDFIRKMIVAYDGINPLSIESCWIQYSYRGEFFPQTGTHLQLLGDSGPLHKDWEWTVDFPFYHRKLTNLHRFYSQRIAHLSRPVFLGERLCPHYQEQQERFIRQMQPYCRRINSESYDFLYYYVTADRSNSYNLADPAFMMYAPLAELELVRYAYHLPRRKRFFHQYMREVTTRGNRDIARIPTTHTTNASSEFLYELKDVFCQLYDWGQRAVHMVYRHFTHKLLYQPKREWFIEEDVRSLHMASEAVSWAIGQSLLTADATAQSLPERQLERIIHLYFLSREYGITCREETGTNA